MEVMPRLSQPVSASPTRDELRRLFAYDEWANARFLRVLETLDDEALGREIESSFPSVLATFAHLVSSEWVWLERWRRHSPSSFPAWMTEPELDDLRTRLASVEEERRAWLESRSEEDLQRPLDYRNLAGEAFTNRLADLCRHVVNHSSYHRGQLTTLLRQVGAEPPSTDYVRYLREVATPGAGPTR